MNIKRIVIGCIMAMSTTAFATDVKVTVTPSKTNQKVEGIGGGIVYYQNWFTAHSNKEMLYDTIFNGLGISALRIGNWAQNVKIQSISNDINIVEGAKKRLGRENFFIQMSSWSAPASLKANNSVNGTNGGVKASLKKDDNGEFVYGEFGKWWKKSLELYGKYDIMPDYISIQNEPDMDATYEATLFNPSESSSIASYGKALEAVSDSIKNIENAPKILGPEPLGIGWQQTQKYVDALDKSLLYGYCFHYYHSGVNTHNENQRYSYPDDFKTAMTSLSTYLKDKPMFMTENCSMRDHEDMDALYIAWFIANSFNINKVSSYIHWNLLWGDNGGGCINVENPWKKEEWTTENGFIVQPEYHGLRHYTKYVKRGWYHIDSKSSNNDVISTAFRSANGEAVTIVIVNKSVTKHNVTLNMALEDSVVGTVIRTEPEAQIWSKSEGAFNPDTVIEMPAKSIITIALKGFTPLPVPTAIKSDLEVAQFVKLADGSLLIGSDKANNVTMKIWNEMGTLLAQDNITLAQGVNSIPAEKFKARFLIVQLITADGKSQAFKVVNM